MMNIERQNQVKGNRATFRTGRAGFTLIEMIIALGLLALMMAIIFVPLNQAFSAFRIGQARSELQQAGRQTLDQMARELRTAVRVFPNDVLPGVTDGAPYNNRAPYIEGVSPSPAADSDSCSNTAQRVPNTARIDFIPADVDASGTVITPIRPAKYLVTYYARRVNPNQGYDPISNPVVLFRAQSPIRNENNLVVQPNGTTEATPGGVRNVDVSANRYNGTAFPAEERCTNRGSLWMYQNNRGEPIGLMNAPLTPKTKPADSTINDAGTVSSAETQLSPRGMSLTLRNLTGTMDTVGPPAVVSTADLKPNSWFTPEDANGDGKIDRITISLSLDRIDAGTMARSNPRPATDANPSSANGLYRVRLPLVVDLPNVM